MTPTSHGAPASPLPIRARGRIEARVRVPGSKSLTNRALPVAALAQGASRLDGALASEDTEAMRSCLAQLGVRIGCESEHWIVHGRGGKLQRPDGPLDARASGTTARFLTALATLAPGPIEIDGTPRMRERPIEELVRTLRALGAGAEALGRDGCPPVRVAGGGLPGGSATIDAGRSSQFVSAVLLAAPYASRDVTLSLADGRLVSRPYVELTLQVMRAFGAEAGWQDGDRLHVRAGRQYESRRYPIEPDASSAAYVFAAAAIAGGSVCVPGIPADSLQADLGLLDLLQRMGCRVRRDADRVELAAPEGQLRGLDADLTDMPDAALALAVVALFARERSVLRGLGTLRLKESDRLAALVTEIRRLGGRAEARADTLVIEPGPLHGAEIATYDDHRMAMAFALAGLRVAGVSIQDPGCVAKTWPDYFSFLEAL